jgi:tetratricopeptide (TPR) repeat protein
MKSPCPKAYSDDRSARTLSRLRARLNRPSPSARLFQAIGAVLLKRGHLSRRASRYYKEAEAFLLRSLDMNPADPSTLLYLANLHSARREYLTSIWYAERAHALDPKLGMARVTVAEGHAVLGEYARADRYFRRAVEVDPGCDVARRNLNRWLDWQAKAPFRRGGSAPADHWPGGRSMSSR